MRTPNKLLALALFIALFSASPAVNRGRCDDDHRSSHGGKKSAVAYHDTWRKLWEDHITWTRMVIIGIEDGLPGTAAYEARLIQNYEDMEDALAPYYGDQAEVLGDLIQDHLLIAVDILTAAKAGDTNAVGTAVAAWYQNGRDIAQFMARLNPKHWKRTDIGTMWKDHLDHTLAEALAHLSNDFAGDVAAYDKVHELALEMADFFSNGVIRQFDNRFKDENALKHGD